MDVQSSSSLDIFSSSSTSPMLLLSSLPQPVHLHILSFLPRYSIDNLSLVSHYWNSLILSSPRSCQRRTFDTVSIQIQGNNRPLVKVKCREENKTIKRCFVVKRFHIKKSYHITSSYNEECNDEDDDEMDNQCITHLPQSLYQYLQRIHNCGIVEKLKLDGVHFSDDCINNLINIFSKVRHIEICHTELFLKKLNLDRLHKLLLGLGNDKLTISFVETSIELFDKTFWKLCSDNLRYLDLDTISFIDYDRDFRSTLITEEQFNELTLNIPQLHLGISNDLSQDSITRVIKRSLREGCQSPLNISINLDKPFNINPLSQFSPHIQYIKSKSFKDGKSGSIVTFPSISSSLSLFIPSHHSYGNLNIRVRPMPKV